MGLSVLLTLQLTLTWLSLLQESRAVVLKPACILDVPKTTVFKILLYKLYVNAGKLGQSVYVPLYYRSMLMWPSMR